jgi:hypothetical protein
MPEPQTLNPKRWRNPMACPCVRRSVCLSVLLLRTWLMQGISARPSVHVLVCPFCSATWLMRGGPCPLLRACAWRVCPCVRLLRPSVCLFVCSATWLMWAMHAAQSMCMEGIGYQLRVASLLPLQLVHLGIYMQVRTGRRGLMAHQRPARVHGCCGLSGRQAGRQAGESWLVDDQTDGRQSLAHRGRWLPTPSGSDRQKADFGELLLVAHPFGPTLPACRTCKLIPNSYK